MSKPTYFIFPEGAEWTSEMRTVYGRWACEWVTFCLGNREVWRFVSSGGCHLPRRIVTVTWI